MVLKICEKCKDQYNAIGRAKYCLNCRPVVRRAQNRKALRKLRASGYSQPRKQGSSTTAEYMREYRTQNPEYVQRNRKQTRERGIRKRMANSGDENGE